MKNTWTHVLRGLTPNYDNLVEALFNGPQYKCVLSKQGRETVLTLSEYWDIDNHHEGIHDHSEQFDDYIGWIDEQLSTWKNVRRMAWDKWHFKRRKDAEKFIILFTLKWTS